MFRSFPSRSAFSSSNCFTERCKFCTFVKLSSFFLSVSFKFFSSCDNEAFTASGSISSESSIMVHICPCLGIFFLSQFLYNFVFPGRVHFSMTSHCLIFHLLLESATSWQGLGACALRNLHSNSYVSYRTVKKHIDNRRSVD